MNHSSIYCSVLSHATFTRKALTPVLQRVEEIDTECCCSRSYSEVTYRKCNFTQFLHPVFYFKRFYSEHERLLRGLHQESLAVLRAAVYIRSLGHADAVAQSDDLQHVRAYFTRVSPSGAVHSAVSDARSNRDQAYESSSGVPHGTELNA